MTYGDEQLIQMPSGFWIPKQTKFQRNQLAQQQVQQNLEPVRDWKAHWKAQEQPWRREPEIDRARQQFLRQRLQIEPDDEQDIYPFKEVPLIRADIEWLVEEHKEENLGKEKQQQRLDLRKAILRALDCTFSRDKWGRKKTRQVLRSLLFASMAICIESEPVVNEVLQRFDGVYLQDGTVISLPNEMEEIFKGCGGSTSQSGRSAMRVQVRLNLPTGTLQGPWLQEAVACERKGEGSEEQVPLPPNALWVVDSHYPTMTTMKGLSQEGEGWITHMKADIVVFSGDGVKQTLPQFIAAHGKENVIDEWIQIGGTKITRQRVRLIAFRVSEQTAQRRREQVNAQSLKRSKGARRDVRVGKKHQLTSNHGRHRYRPGKKRIALSDWEKLSRDFWASFLLVYPCLPCYPASKKELSPCHSDILNPSHPTRVPSGLLAVPPSIWPFFSGNFLNSMMPRLTERGHG